MAQQQANIHIAEAGFNGLDTVRSPITQDTSYAAVADNCVIDGYGRIGARHAFAEDTATLPTVAAIPGAVTHKWLLHNVHGGSLNYSLKVLSTATYTGYDADGLVVGQTYHLLERVTDTLVDLTLPVMTDDTALVGAHIVPTDDRWYICCEGNEVMVWDGTTVILISADPNYDGLEPNVGDPIVPPTYVGALASHGRIWGWVLVGDMQTIYYSDLLIGASHYQATPGAPSAASTAGAINVLEFWPNGYDEIKTLAVHNNKLVVFGRRSILIYEMGYGDPADAASGFALIDTITNVGLVSRDAVAHIGTDLLFMDDTGVRSLGRTIQEVSSPMGDLTHNVRFDISHAIFEETDKSRIKMEYDSTENFVIALFSGYAYILDLKSYLTQGIAKITTWSQCAFNDLTYCEADGSEYLFFAGNDNQGLMEYRDYTEYGNVPYEVTYRSNPLTFGQPANSKFVKQIDYTILSQFTSTTGIATWGYDQLETNKSRGIFIDAIDPAYYGVAKFAEAKFGNSEATLKRYRVNTGGKGELFVLGLEVQINGNAFSLQEINIQALMGRLN